MKKGVVMETRNNRATVLLNGGDFVDVPAQKGWQTGDIVSVERTRQKSAVYKSLLAAACLALVLLGTLGYFTFMEPVSVISMDINPSIELQVNRQGRVIGVTGYNEDGEVLLDSLSLKGMSYTQAVEKLIESQEMQTYLKNNNYILFAVYAKTGDEAILQYLENITQDLGRQYGIEAECSGVGRQDMEQARSHDMSCGKWLKLNELQQLDPDINTEDYSHCDVGEIQQEIWGHHGYGHGQQNGQGNAGGGTGPGDNNAGTPPQNGDGHGYGGGNGGNSGGNGGHHSDSHHG